MQSKLGSRHSALLFITLADQYRTWGAVTLSISRHFDITNPRMTLKQLIYSSVLLPQIHWLMNHDCKCYGGIHCDVSEEIGKPILILKKGYYSESADLRYL
jgi:hypothetical protein